MSSPVQPSLAPFLRLPTQIRKAIYIHAGAICDPVKPVTIDLSYSSYHFKPKLKENILTTGILLRICRSIYEELGEMVYSDNHIFVGDDDQLQALQSINPKFIQAMTVLTVHLNETSCGEGEICEYFLEHCMRTDDYNKFPICLSKEPSNYDKDYWGIIKTARALIDEWTTTWTTYLRPNLRTPGQLNLHIVCDVLDYETGLAAMQPLLQEKTPMLASCSVRLSQERVPELQSLAERTVDCVTLPKVNTLKVSSIENVGFRFMDLPAELRRQILFHTPLVTPYRQVQWSSKKVDYRQIKYNEYSDAHYEHWVHGSPFKPFVINIGANDPGCWSLSNPTGCYCKVWHSAHSSAYECKCYRGLTSLFLVSKSFRLDALDVFFGRNHFKVMSMPEVLGERPVTEPPARLEPAIFLDEFVPKDGLPFLRKLTITFPAFGDDKPCDFCPLDGVAWKDWNRVIQSVKSGLDCSKLILRIRFAPWSSFDCSNRFPDYRKYMTEAQSLAIQQTYKDIIMPLSQLGGFNELWMSLTDPRAWRYVGPDVGQYDEFNLRPIEFYAYLKELGQELGNYVNGVEESSDESEVEP